MGDAMSIVRGTLDLLVLKALSDEERHGFEVTRWIEARTGGALEFDDSAIYQALYRLDRRGLVDSRWARTEHNRRARYYGITRSGRTHLAEETDVLMRYTATVADVLNASPGQA